MIFAESADESLAIVSIQDSLNVYGSSTSDFDLTSYLLINVSLVSSSLFFKNLLPQRCFSISILSLYSLKVVLHFSQVILPKILFSIISLLTFKKNINLFNDFHN